jgi:FtsP/CotA-like multicopper oxidase with cupredoxin domain
VQVVISIAWQADSTRGNGKKMRRLVIPLLVAVALLVGAAGPACAQGVDPCPRPAQGSVVTPPPELRSQNGTLDVTFNYYEALDAAGHTVFCFATPDGVESPTLRIHPGDTLNISLTNLNPPAPPGSPTEIISNASNVCGDMTMTITSVNMHFHGTNTSPDCHSDQVVHTIVNSGETFQYSVTFPKDEPPGLYWYHPHVHGIAEAAVQGGASGAIVVEGIADIQPAVAGLPERILLIRDMPRFTFLTTSAPSTQAGSPPPWDISVNYVPVIYQQLATPHYTPAIIKMQAGAREFWRVANASADTIVDLELQYDGVNQPLEIVALDGVPTGSQDGTRVGKPVAMTHILLPPAGRAEFIMTGPSASVASATLFTLAPDNGPGGEVYPPTRPLANIQTAPPSADLPIVPAPRTPNPQRFEGLADATPSASRTLYFSEVLLDPNNPESPTNFFITVDGATPTLFDPNLPPAIVTTQGSVEDWTIENRTNEAHEFHMHQIHFLVEAEDGVVVPPDQRQFHDTIQVPFWTGKGPYPSVTLRMDFRGPDIGDFVYHCHILAHEDAGMMAIARVLPAASASTQLVSAVLPQSRSVQVGAAATTFATLDNFGTATGSACRVAPQTSVPESFFFQTTDPLTNMPTGVPNAPIDIGAGQSQSFVLGLTPSAAFAPTDVAFNFSCANAAAAPSLVGVNTLNLSASTTPVPDIVVLAASSDPGYVDIPGATGTGFFAVATDDLGAGAAITVSVDTGTSSLPVNLAVCQTDPNSGACLASPAVNIVTTIAANATPSFGVFVTGSGAVSDSPGVNRVFVRFTDTGGVLRGETSIAVRTQ